MSETALENPGLRLKLRPSKGAASAAAGGVSDADIWGTVIPRVSEKAVSLIATLGGYSVGETDLATILADWDATTLSLLLEGPGGARGLVQLEAQIIAGLTEVQTVGRVLDKALTERPANPIDATLCDHVVSAWFTGVSQAREGRDKLWAVADQVADQRAAKVLLDEGDFSATEITVALGGGARTGVMRILHPLSRPKTKTLGTPQAPGGREAILGVPAELEAILHRTRVPLSWLRNLEVGAILEIPRTAIEHVRLETTEGRRVGRAHLGRSGEFRAVRVLADDAPSTIGASTEATFEEGGTSEVGLGGAAAMGIGSLPDLSGSDAVEIAAPGELPDLGGGGLPDLDGGGLPPLPGEGGLPDLSDGGGLPDLPDLPELPQIE